MVSSEKDKCYHLRYDERWECNATLVVEVPSKRKIKCRDCEADGFILSTPFGIIDIQWGDDNV